MPVIPSSARIKGSFIIPIVKALRTRRDDALAMLPPRLHPYLSGRLLAGSWYPEQDHVELRKALGTLLAHIPNVWSFLGTTAARLYGRSLYRAMVVNGDPRLTLQTFPNYWPLGHSSGRLTVAFERGNAASIEIFDYQAASDETCGTIQGFYAELLKMAGAIDVQIAKRSCLASGGTHCRWDVSWSSTDDVKAS